MNPYQPSFGGNIPQDVAEATVSHRAMQPIH